MNPEVVIIIPARYSSSRLPGKPLLMLAGKPLIQHVYERALRIADGSDVIVATDHEKIKETVERFNGKCRLTPSDIQSGSDRIGYIAKNLDAEIIVNVQGDEPLVPYRAVREAIRELKKSPDLNLCTLGCPLISETKWLNPSLVKVLVDSQDNALYFSRAPLPYFRDGEFEPHNRIMQHIGVYIFRRKFLLKYINWKPTPFEKAEKLEQLRVLENGYKIKVIRTDECSPGIDTPEDVKRIEKLLKEKGQKLENSDS